MFSHCFTCIWSFSDWCRISTEQFYEIGTEHSSAEWVHNRLVHNECRTEQNKVASFQQVSFSSSENSLTFFKLPLQPCISCAGSSKSTFPGWQLNVGSYVIYLARQSKLLESTLWYHDKLKKLSLQDRFDHSIMFKCTSIIPMNSSSSFLLRFPTTIIKITNGTNKINHKPIIMVDATWN